LTVPEISSGGLSPGICGILSLPPTDNVTFAPMPAAIACCTASGS
jgi:hypothetical protein